MADVCLEYLGAPW